MQLHALQEAWDQLQEVNTPLSDQHDGIFLLLDYVNKKLVHRANKWYTIGKQMVEQQRGLQISEVTLEAWLNQLSAHMEKSMQMVELLDGKSTTTRNSVMTLFQVSYA